MGKLPLSSPCLWHIYLLVCRQYPHHPHAVQRLCPPFGCQRVHPNKSYMLHIFNWVHWIVPRMEVEVLVSPASVNLPRSWWVAYYWPKLFFSILSWVPLLCGLHCFWVFWEDQYNWEAILIQEAATRYYHNYFRHHHLCCHWFKVRNISFQSICLCKIHESFVIVGRRR